MIHRHSAPPLSRDAPRQSNNGKKKPAITVTVIVIIALLTFASISSQSVQLSQYNMQDETTLVAAGGSRSMTSTPATAARTTAAAGEGDASVSPACRPHFRLALPDGNWTQTIKFKRLYFYHARKAGGTTLRRYFQKVAAHHGLRYAVTEYDLAEDPSSHDGDEPTFYVTHLREPVSRSISHFKYEGRWDCRELIDNVSFVPTEENANKLETWNKHYGHELSSCRPEKDKTTGEIHSIFRLALCAVNCYSQWFAGLSCPQWDPPKIPGPGPEGMPMRREVPMTRQHDVAKRKMLRYNLIVITELLRDEDYVAAIERFFGVPGITTEKVHPFCEVESHYANERTPLVIRNETLTNLTRLNEIDIRLYHEMRDCIDKKTNNGYNFLAWDSDRFEADEAIRVDAKQWVISNPVRGYEKPRRTWLKKFDVNDTAAGDEPSSPACRPHFDLALPDGKWTNTTRFRRLYFYHARRAGGTNLRRYFEKVAAHHGLEFVVTESFAAEDPGSHDEATFYVTHMKEPTSRSIGQFKHEGRWDCGQMTTNMTFLPTKENARLLETWNQSFGHRPSHCAEEEGEALFMMEKCAVNCYIQWFSGLSCPWWDPPPNPGPGASPIRRERKIASLYKVAREKLLRYNFILITEMLRDPTYVASVERFFGVPGVVSENKHLTRCERESQYANERIPLIVDTEAKNELMRLNVRDIHLYFELKGCLDRGDYNIPMWDPDRFETNKTIQVNYNVTEERRSKALDQMWLDRIDKVHGELTSS